MLMTKTSAKGFTLVETVIVVLVIAVLAFGSWFIWHKSHKNNKTIQASRNQSDYSKKDIPRPDQYPGWKTYDSDVYSITFRYPVKWNLVEENTDASKDAIRQEHVINLKRNEDGKYNETATFEILDESISAAATWYDDYFAQSALNKVIKTNNQLEGKPSIQYAVTNSGEYQGISI